MPRLAAVVVLFTLLIGAGLWLWSRGTLTPDDATRPGNAGRADAPAPAQGAGPDAAPAQGALEATSHDRAAVPDGDPGLTFTLRGAVLADPAAPDLTGLRVLAWRGEPQDVGGLVPGAMAGQSQRARPAFVLEGDPIAAAVVDAAGNYELHTRHRHLRVAIDHDLYLLAVPEVVHVPQSTRSAELVLSPLLGGKLQGRLLGARATDVERVEVSMQPDVMSVMRDARALMAAMLAATRPPATPHGDGRFEFRALPPGAAMQLTVAGGRAAARSEQPPLLPGEVREIVVPVAPAAMLRVEVIDEYGGRVADAHVSVGPASGGGMAAMLRRSHGTTDDAGEYTFASLDPGSYRVEAAARGTTTAREVVGVLAGEEPTTVRMVVGEGGVVTGVVLDPDGQPIADARVAHQPGENLPIVGDMTAQLGADQLATMAADGSRTDAEGRFRLTGLADDGEFAVIGAHDDYTAGVTRGVRMGATDVVVQLRRRGALRGRVVGVETEFTVSLLRTSFVVMQTPVRCEVFAGGDGAFALTALAPDDYTLQIEAEGFALRQTTVTVAEGSDTDVGALELQRAARVRGVVLDENGTPVRGALVRRRRGAMADNPMMAMLGNGDDVRAYSDADGRFELAPVPPGGLQLLATAQGFAPGKGERLVLEPGQQLDGVVVELGHGGSIRGHVVCGPGQRPSDFLVLVQHQITQSSHAADLGGDGAFVVGDLEPGAYNVQAMPHDLMSSLGNQDWRPGEGLRLGETMRKMIDGVVSQRCSVRSGEQSEVTLEVGDLAIGAQWYVRVELGDRTLATGMVEAIALDGGALRVALLQDGVAVFGRMQPGQHRLQVRTGMSMTPVGAPTELTFPADVAEASATLRLPGGELRGRVIDATSGQPLRAAVVRLANDEHRERDDTLGVALTGPDGTFCFTGLADGRYSVIAAEPLLGGGSNVASRQNGIAVVSGAPGAPVELRSRPAAGASVLVTDAAGAPIAGATVLCVDAEGRPLGGLAIAATGPDGRASFGGMADGTARVVGRAPGLAPGVSQPLQLSAAAATQFTLALGPGAATRVCPVAADGSPLRGATVLARVDDGPWLPAMLLVRSHGHDGVIDLGSLGPGAWHFRVSHPQLGTVERSRSITGSGPVTIVVSR